jgi:hypothetical protein
LLTQRARAVSRLRQVYNPKLQRVAIHDVAVKHSQELCRLLETPVLKLDEDLLGDVPDSFESVSKRVMEQGKYVKASTYVYMYQYMLRIASSF